MLIRGVKFWIVVLAYITAVSSVQAQMLANPKGPKATAPTTERIFIPQNPTNDLLSPVAKKFDEQTQKANEAKGEPQVFHFKIVNDKVTVDDPDKRNILVYYDNYRIIRSFDKLTKCSIRVYVINDLKEKITSLGFKLHWPDISTAVEMVQVKPGVKTYTDLMLLGDGCLRLDKIPTIEVNRCRVKGMSQDACADAIKWMPR